MLAFTDEQLALLQRLAAPLAPPDRGRFLEAVAAKLAERPELLGDGHLHRVAVEAQRQFWPAPAVGGIKPKQHFRTEPTDRTG